MVVLAAAICSKNGKVLMSRQFVEMTRVRIEGLLAAFPKLRGTDDAKQHTFIETESVRYVYQPMEGLYLLLLTNRSSNIVEDLETLRLLSKVVADVAGSTNEEDILKFSFELVFAFDEVVVPGGYREYINLQGIRTNMEMESHEERLHKLIEQSRMDAAKEQMTKKSREITKERRKREDLERQSGISGAGGGGKYEGFGGGGSGGATSQAPADPYSTQSSYVPSVAETTDSYRDTEKPKPKSNKKGMSLGMKGKGTSQLDAMAKEEHIDYKAAEKKRVKAPTEPTAKPKTVANTRDPVALTIEEKLIVTLNREGGLEQMEVKGTLSLTANSAEAARCRLMVDTAEGLSSGFNFQTHPKVDKGAFDGKSTIQLKDTKRPFPSGKGVGVLRWGLKSTDEDMLPFDLTCWPEEGDDGQFNVNVEYTLKNTDLRLENVDIVIPLGGGEAPTVESAEHGVYQYNPSNQSLLWHLDAVDSSNETGTLEFNVEGTDMDAFFPVTISFSSPETLCPVVVGECVTVEDETSINFGLARLLNADFKVE